MEQNRNNEFEAAAPVEAPIQPELERADSQTASERLAEIGKEANETVLRTNEAVAANEEKVSEESKEKVRKLNGFARLMDKLFLPSYEKALARIEQSTYGPQVLAQEEEAGKTDPRRGRDQYVEAYRRFEEHTKWSPEKGEYVSTVHTSGPK